MYRDRLLNLGGFSFSFKGALWTLGAIAWTVGLFDRLISIFVDGHIVTQEIFQLLIITAVLISWFYLKPSSRLKGNFSTGIDEIINLEAKNNIQPSPIPVKHTENQHDTLNPH